VTKLPRKRPSRKKETEEEEENEEEIDGGGAILTPSESFIQTLRSFTQTWLPQNALKHSD